MECFNPLRWSIDGIPGEARPPTSKDCVLAAPVFKLSKLGFFLALKVGGLINDGDEGSDDSDPSTLVLRFSARLFGFLALRGPGDVMGRSSLIGTRRTELELLSATLRL